MGGLSTELRAPLALLRILRVLSELGAGVSGGIFCRSVVIQRTVDLREALEAGQAPSIRQEPDVNVWAALLTSFLRELGEPVVPVSSYADCVAAGAVDQADRAATVERCVMTFPPVHARVVYHVVEFLRTVDADATGVAAVF